MIQQKVTTNYDTIEGNSKQRRHNEWLGNFGNRSSIVLVIAKIITKK